MHFLLPLPFSRRRMGSRQMSSMVTPRADSSRKWSFTGVMSTM